MVLWTSLAAAALVVVHSVLWDVARWDGHSFIADNADLVGIGAAKANVFRMSLLADAFGSYLLTVPATVGLWRLLRAERDDGIVDVLALGGLFYAVAGAVAAVVWAEGGADLIRRYAERGGSQAEAAQFATLAHSAIATWQIVCVFCAGAWWLGSGWLLRGRWTWFARYSMSFGALSLVLGFLKAAGADFDLSAPATAVFLTLAIWIGWLGRLLSSGRR